MRSNILQKYPRSAVRVYVVWFDMLPGDSRDLVDRKVLNDRRVTNYFDPGRVVGSWFAEHTNAGGIVWDAYFLYGPDAAWTAQPWTSRPGGGNGSAALPALVADRLHPSVTSTPTGVTR